MKKIKILSWNVNGLRAIHKKGFLGWLVQTQPGILCVQETKASAEQIPEELKHINGYNIYYNAAEKKGYSGVGMFTRLKPRSFQCGLGIQKYDSEGIERPGYTVKDRCEDIGYGDTTADYELCFGDLPTAYADQNNKLWTMDDLRGRTLMFSAMQYG